MSNEDKVEAVTEALLLRDVLPSPTSLNAKYERALGKLAMQFSLLHISLELFSWELWELDAHIGLILTKDLPIKHLTEKLRATAEHRFPKNDGKKKFYSILNRVDKVAKQRNDMLHALWVITEGKPVFCLRRNRGKFNTEVPSVDDVNAIIQSVLEITADFLDFKKQGLLGLVK